MRTKMVLPIVVDSEEELRNSKIHPNSSFVFTVRISDLSKTIVGFLLTQVNSSSSSSSSSIKSALLF
jgi:hypothetical protein